MIRGTKGKLDGMADVLARLKNLKESARNRVLRPAVAKATRLLAKRAKQTAPIGPTRLLRKSIGAKVKVYRLAVVGVIGARTGFRTVINGRPVDPTKYLHLAELGRKAISVIRKKALARGGEFFGRKVAAARGSRFLERAWAAGKAEAAAVITAEVAAGLEKLAAKKGE